MPKAIHIADDRKRDAEVAVDIQYRKSGVKSVLPDGRDKINVKILKTTVNNDLQALQEKYGDLRSVAEALIDADPEVDMETAGKKLRNTHKLFVDQNNKIVYRLNMYQVIRNPDGSEKQIRDLNRVPSNANVDIPLKWTGRMFPRKDAVRQFVFSRKYQLMHINGVTFDFLYNMAKELQEKDSVVLVGAGKRGTDPILLTRGGTPYRGFLEGRVKEDTYILILHFSDIELKGLTSKE